MDGVNVMYMYIEWVVSKDFSVSLFGFEFRRIRWWTVWGVAWLLLAGSVIPAQELECRISNYLTLARSCDSSALLPLSPPAPSPPTLSAPPLKKAPFSQTQLTHSTTITFTTQDVWRCSNPRNPHAQRPSPRPGRSRAHTASSPPDRGYP